MSRGEFDLNKSFTEIFENAEKSHGLDSSISNDNVGRVKVTKESHSLPDLKSSKDLRRWEGQLPNIALGFCVLYLLSAENNEVYVNPFECDDKFLTDEEKEKLQKKAITEVHEKMAPREDRATISKEQLMKMLADSDENTTSFDFEVARKQVDLSSDEDFKAASVERYKELVAEIRKSSSSKDQEQDLVAKRILSGVVVFTDLQRSKEMGKKVPEDETKQSKRANFFNMVLRSARGAVSEQVLWAGLVRGNVHGLVTRIITVLTVVQPDIQIAQAFDKLSAFERIPGENIYSLEARLMGIVDDYEEAGGEPAPTHVVNVKVRAALKTYHPLVPMINAELATNPKIRYDALLAKMINEMAKCSTQGQEAITDEIPEKTVAGFVAREERTQHCRNWAKGKCTYGDKCIYLHDHDKKGKVKHQPSTDRYSNHECYNCGETGHIKSHCPKKDSNEGARLAEAKALVARLEKKLEAGSSGNAKSTSSMIASTEHNHESGGNAAAAENQWVRFYSQLDSEDSKEKQNGNTSGRAAHTRVHERHSLSRKCCSPCRSFASPFTAIFLVVICMFSAIASRISYVRDAVRNACEERVPNFTVLPSTFTSRVLLLTALCLLVGIASGTCTETHTPPPRADIHAMHRPPCASQHMVHTNSRGTRHTYSPNSLNDTVHEHGDGQYGIEYNEGIVENGDDVAANESDGRQTHSTQAVGCTAKAIGGVILAFGDICTRACDVIRTHTHVFMGKLFPDSQSTSSAYVGSVSKAKNRVFISMVEDSGAGKIICNNESFFPFGGNHKGSTTITGISGASGAIRSDSMGTFEACFAPENTFFEEKGVFPFGDSITTAIAEDGSAINKISVPESVFSSKISVNLLSSRQLAMAGYAVIVWPGGEYIKITKPHRNGVIAHYAYWDKDADCYAVDMVACNDDTEITDVDSLTSSKICTCSSFSASCEDEMKMSEDDYESSAFLANTFTGSEELGMLLHRRFGHVGKNKKLLDKLSEVHGRKINFDFMCKHCITTKAQQITTKFAPSRRKADRAGYRIHSDILVLNNFPGVGGYKYVCIFVDEFSGYVWTEFLRSKSEFSTVFSKKVIEIKQHCGQLSSMEEGLGIAQLRTDNAKEHLSAAVAEICKANGIIHETTVAYSPHQNGLAERMIGIIWNGAEAMRTSACLPPKYWPFAVAAFVHVKNRMPNNSRNANVRFTPFEAWHDIDVEFGTLTSHLRRLGCKCYVYVPKQHHGESSPHFKSVLSPF